MMKSQSIWYFITATIGILQWRMDEWKIAGDGEINWQHQDFNSVKPGWTVLFAGLALFMDVQPKWRCR